MVFSKIRSKNKYKLFINGAWIFPKSKDYINVINPFSNELVGRVSAAKRKEISTCLDSADKAKKVMRNLSAKKRHDILMRAARLLEKHSEDFARIIIRESGKPRVWANSEIKATIERLKLAAEEPMMLKSEDVTDDSIKIKATIVNEPVGTVLAISPFNYPLFTGASKVAEAVASANSVILKPASAAPICLLMFARLMELAGLPKGGLNVLTGRGSDLGDSLITDSRVNMISFTGSSSVGKRIAELIGMRHRILELGGKCPAIILKDADLNLAAKECVNGCFKISGQRCDAVSLVLANKSIADKFLKLVKEELKNWKTGDPNDKDVKVGPLINESAVKNVDELVSDALRKGAHPSVTGKINGLIYPITVLDKVTSDMKIAREEIFGPVMPIIRVKDDNEAIKIAVSSRYGLDACIFSKDSSKAMKYSLLLGEGSVHINRSPSHGAGKLPFGGNKDSGVGREGVNYSIKEMTRKKTIILNTK